MLVRTPNTFSNRSLPHSSQPISVARVLIADDNRDGAETLEMLLKMSGHEVHLAHSGAEAIAMRVAMSSRIWLVLDIGMPVLERL